MTIARLLALFVTIAWLAGARAQVPPQQQQQAPAGPIAPVTLNYATDLVDSGLDVRAGDQLTLSVEALPRGQQLSPSGNAAAQETGRFPQFLFGAVVGEIGGEPFLIGASWSGPAPATGRLRLGLNQNPNGQSNDIPMFRVSIVHVPQPPPPDPPPDETNTLDDDAANLLDGQSNGLDAGAGNVAAGNPQNGVQPIGLGGGESNGGWLVPLLVGAGGMLALLLVGLLLGKVLRPKRLLPPSVVVHPSLDRGEGGVTGDEIALAGPEVRLRTALEPGATLFDEGEPAIEEERRDG